MDLLTVAVIAALTLSLTSIALTIAILPKIYSYVKGLIEEFGVSLLVRKKYRRVKRYILVKILCVDSSFQQFSGVLKQRVNRLLGPLLRYRCSIDVLSYKPTSGYAILRVRGEAPCVIYTLLALSVQHLSEESSTCMAIPIKTSGLISRLRRRYLKSGRP